MTEHMPDAQGRDATAESAAIVAKVIDILDSRELIIDAGSDDGVELGMRFVILGETTVNSDRAANGRLTVRFKKTIVKIVRILDEFHSVGRTFKVVPGRPARPSPLTTTLGAIRALESTPAIPEHVETLDVGEDTSTVVSRIPASEKKIYTGDVAEQTWGDEYDS